MAGLVLRPRRSKVSKSIATRARPLKNRGARKRVSYTEPSSDPEDDSSQDDFVPEMPTPPRRGRSAAPPSASMSKKRKAPVQGRGRPKFRRLGAPIKARDQDAKTHKRPYDIHFTGNKMPWHTLPYHVLTTIFDYASYPLINEHFQSNPSTAWLAQVARLCKGFAEPALSVLYASPPLSPPSRVRHLIERLEAQNVASFLDYKAKINNIDLEATQILGRKSDGQEPVELSRLLVLTPQLRRACLHLLGDHSRLHAGFSHRHWKVSYSHNMVDTMVVANIRLQDWTWNSLFFRSLQLPDLLDIHKSSAFQSVHSLCFANIEERDLRRSDETLQSSVLARSLEVLPNLRNLTFRNSSVLNDILFEALPKHLESLEVNDCPIFRDHIDRFLLTNGQNLRHLTLDHNRYLTLSWLNHLATSCPKLETLKMDMIYNSVYATVADSDPQYKQLLTPEDKPSWPSRIQIIELYHMRKWETTVANNFFWSLVNVAPSLSDLRQLKIKASLDESGWRDRIAFRDRWTQRLKNVFLRKSDPPKQHLQSIAAFRGHKAGQQKGTVVHGGAKLHHVQIPVRKSEKGSTSESDSDKPLANIRRSRRTKSMKHYNESSSEDEMRRTKMRHRRRHQSLNGSSDEDSAKEDTTIIAPQAAKKKDDDNGVLHIQGMCDVVDILIDNLRPTEEQLHESDFLDEEASGDEDWNGDDDMIGDDGYAW